MKILVVHGPNLNLLGKRENNIYGSKTLDEVNDEIRKEAMKLMVEVEIFQSNHEGDIIDKLHDSMGRIDYIIMNPGAYTHYSYAIRDAVAAIEIPTIEVHISKVHQREEFRSISVIAPVCVGQISGFSHYSYIMALKYAVEQGFKEMKNEGLREITGKNRSIR